MTEILNFPIFQSYFLSPSVKLKFKITFSNVKVIVNSLEVNVLFLKLGVLFVFETGVLLRSLNGLELGYVDQAGLNSDPSASGS